MARSLLVLRDQIDAMAPGRSRASDGTIGDAAHQAVQSEHNPDRWGVVRALDITHDPANGCDIDKITDALQAGRDPRILYVIANRLIMSGPGGPAPWVWRTYHGDDPHTNHLHLSVVAEAIADSTTPWALPGLTGTETDMEQTERLLAETGHGGRTVADHFGDLQRLRGWLIGEGGKSADVPPAGSPLARILAAADRPQAQVVLTAADREAIITAVTTQVLDGVEARLRAVLGSLDGR